MLIRDMEEKDLKEVAELYEILSEQESNIEKMAQKFSIMKKDPNYNLIVSEEDAMVTGTIMGIVCHNMVADFNSFLVIESVIVDEKHRGNGFGKAMLLEMEKRAKAKSCSYIILVSGKQRKEAHKLYEGLGYGVDGARGFRKIL